MKKIGLIVFFLSALTSNAQCAMCRAVVESGGKAEAEGINHGILYLMIFPYLLIGVLFYFFMKYRRNKNSE